VTYNTLLDERHLTVWTSPSGKRHVEGWFGETLCGSWIDRSGDWHYGELTSLRYLAKIAQNPSTTWCKRCINNYKDVRTS
jgi:hypothetical protein